MSGFTYLASPPYSDPSLEVRERRYRAALDCCGWMLKNRVWVYAPIVHCHVVALAHELDGGFEFWRDYDFTMIDAASRLAVLVIDGWKESVGVQAELKYALDAGKPVVMILPQGERYGVMTYRGDLE